MGRLSIRASPLVGTRRELARWDGVASIASDQKRKTVSVGIDITVLGARLWRARLEFSELDQERLE